MPAQKLTFPRPAARFDLPRLRLLPSEVAAAPEAAPTFDRWLNRHLDVVRAYPDRWLAVDPSQGCVVVAMADAGSFDAAVEEWIARSGRGPWTFHTSEVLGS